MSNIFQLYRLQQIDSQIDEMKEIISKNERVINDNSEIINLENNVLFLQNQLDQANQELHTIEKQVDSCKLKLSYNQNTLYSGKVKNPKELQDLQLEANSLTNQINGLESDLLAWMIKVDEINAEYADSLKLLEYSKKEKSEKDEELKKNNQEYEHKISILQHERQRILNSIDPSLVDSYEKLRSKKNGVAVSRIVSNSCSVCGATLNSTLIQRARAMEKIVFCDTCNRMLYYG